MKQKLQDRAFERAQGVMQPGERPILAARGTVGKFTSGRFSAIASRAMMVEAGGALGAVLDAQKNQFFVVTDRQVIFLTQTMFGGPGKKVLGVMPRNQITVAEATIAFVSLLRLAFGTSGDGVSLTFPRSDKKDAEALAALLQQAPTG